MNVLVTGAGALLGQGILRSLNQTNLDLTIHTCDPNWRSGGHWLGHHAHQIPLASDFNYVKEIKRIIQENRIEIVFIGTDVELPVFAKFKDQLEKDFPVKIIVSNEKVITIANNKWLTAKFLEDNGFPFPYSFLTSDKSGVKFLKEKAAYPYFAKPVDGARSKGIVKVENQEILEKITGDSNNLVIQEFIGEEDGEFTAGCLVLGGNPVAVVTLKRDLRDGNTYRAYYENEFSKFNDTIKEVAIKLGVEGPCNFQFRIKNGKPVIFEINARFSGTTPLRSFFGFNEVEAILNFHFNNSTVTQPVLKEGEVLRVWADLFITKDEAIRFDNSKEMLNPSAEYFPFKNN